MPPAAKSPDFPKELQPPAVEHRFALYRFQVPGLVLLMLIPILALAGAFGESHADVEARAGDIVVAITHPARLRFEQISTMDIVVTNAGATAMDTIFVSIDPSWLSRFSGVTITPSASSVFGVELTDVASGESRRVHVEMDAMRPGRHHGTVAVTDGAADTVRLDVTTLVFP